MGRMKKKKTDGLSEIPKVPVKNISLNQLVGAKGRGGGISLDPNDSSSVFATVSSASIASINTASIAKWASNRLYQLLPFSSHFELCVLEWGSKDVP